MYSINDMTIHYRDIQQIRFALIQKGPFGHNRLLDENLSIVTDSDSSQLQYDIRMGDKQYNIIRTSEDEELKSIFKIYEMTYSPDLPEGPTEEDEFAHIGNISLSKDGTYFLDWEKPSSCLMLDDDGNYSIDGDITIGEYILNEIDRRRRECMNHIIALGTWKIYD